MKIDRSQPTALSARIAKTLRDAIVSGALVVDQRLPSEAELADTFAVSRATIREALKRLAAQSLIRTERGALGGAFVRHLSYEDARAQMVTTSTLLLSMNEVGFNTACEARFALERACLPLAAARREPAHLAVLQREINRQATPDLDDVAFCASDVAFHRALVDGAGNPVLSYQLAGAIEAMQPLMNMVTFTARSRAEIVALHSDVLTALTARDATAAAGHLDRLEAYTKDLAERVRTARDKAKPPRVAS